MPVRTRRLREQCVCAHQAAPPLVTLVSRGRSTSSFASITRTTSAPNLNQGLNSFFYLKRLTSQFQNINVKDPNLVRPISHPVRKGQAFKLFDFVTNIFYHILPRSRAGTGEGDGTPLQSSCLENPMDGGAWWAAVHGVTKSQTRLSDFTFLFTFMHWRRKWQPTPGFLPGESQGRGSLVGRRLWGRTESDTTEVT